MVISFVLFATWNIFTYNSLAYKKLHADSDWIKIVLVTIMAFWVYVTTMVAKKKQTSIPITLSKYSLAAAFICGDERSPYCNQKHTIHRLLRWYTFYFEFYAHCHWHQL